MLTRYFAARIYSRDWIFFIASHFRDFPWYLLRDHRLGIDERNRVFKRVGSSTWTGLIPTTGYGDKTGRAFRIPVEFSLQAEQGRGCEQSLLFSPPWIQPVNNPCRHHVGKLSTVQG